MAFSDYSMEHIFLFGKYFFPYLLQTGSDIIILH